MVLIVKSEMVAEKPEVHADLESRLKVATAGRPFAPLPCNLAGAFSEFQFD